MKVLLGIQVALLLLSALGCSRMVESLVLLFIQALFYRHVAPWFRILVLALGVYLVMR